MTGDVARKRSENRYFLLNFLVWHGKYLEFFLQVFGCHHSIFFSWLWFVFKIELFHVDSLYFFSLPTIHHL